MISILVALVVFGVLLYLVNNLIPLDGKVRMVINVLAGLFLFLYCLSALGLWHAPPALMR